MSASGYKRCIFMLADGARADVMSALLAAGELPNIEKYMTGPGVKAQAITVFPSTTGPAYLPFVTGRYPGACNLPGIRWFDRTKFGTASPLSMDRTRSYCGPAAYMMNNDLEKEIPTIFELTEKPLNLHNMVTRGLHPSRRRFKLFLDHVIAHYTADHRPIHRKLVQALKRSVVEDFDFLFVSFPGPDTVGHYHHPTDERAEEAYREVDQAVGEVCDLLGRIGCLDDTLLFLSADHGMTETHTHFDLDGFLDRRGFRAYYHPRIFRHWTSADAASMVSGNSMSHLYFKNPKGWEHRTPFEDLDGGRLGALVEELLDSESIEIVAGMGEDGAVRVRSRRGLARIERLDGGDLNYRVERGMDPFGYGPLPQTLTDRGVLDQTFDSGYPDAPMQLIQIFDSRRTGDLVVCAADGHDLRLHNENPMHVGSHGALTRHQMRVPFFTNCPLVEDQPYRTVDFFPTVFSALGWQAPRTLDGIDLTQTKAKEAAA